MAKSTAIIKVTFTSMASLIFISNFANAYTFNDAIGEISQHEAVGQLESRSKSLESESGVKGSWGDPIFKIAAKNYPKDSLEDGNSSMTGLELGISKKIAITTRYGNIERAFEKLGHSALMESKSKKRELVKAFWNYLIESRRVKDEIKIFKENLGWMGKTLKISKRLYSNGKISQQALLEIQIRKSELEAGLSNKQFELKEQKDRLGYLLGLNGELDRKTVPWRLLKIKNVEEDYKEASLKSKVEAKNHLLTASQLAYLPDLTLSFGYTKRANIDKQGDFVSASVSFPLPFSGVKYSAHSKAAHEKSKAEKILLNYKRFRESEESRLTHVTQKIKKELKILNTRTLEYAENSRKVTSKSYSLGSSSYIELLQSELKLQKLKLKRALLLAQLFKNQIAYKFLVGEKLYE
ncbi:TolC family protein [Bdellovibrionales bacterium]|nr:TolC family protein [Bdellovibrionales bacterium]